MPFPAEGYLSANLSRRLPSYIRRPAHLFGDGPNYLESLSLSSGQPGEDKGLGADAGWAGFVSFDVCRPKRHDPESDTVQLTPVGNSEVT